MSLYSPCIAVKILRDSKNALKFTNNLIQILHKDTVNEYLTHLTFLFLSIFYFHQLTFLFSSSIYFHQLERDFEIVPICVETMGPWGPSGLKFVCEVGRRISEESGEPRSTVFLMKAIGMTIQRGNAASVLGTVCKGQHLEEMYYL